MLLEKKTKVKEKSSTHLPAEVVGVVAGEEGRARWCAQRLDVIVFQADASFKQLLQVGRYDAFVLP